MNHICLQQTVHMLSYKTLTNSLSIICDTPFIIPVLIKIKTQQQLTKRVPTPNKSLQLQFILYYEPIVFLQQ